MKNIELKELYWKSEIKEKEVIVSELMSRVYKSYRVRQGNVDLLLHIIAPYAKDDKVVVKMVNGVYELDELKKFGISIINE